MGRILKCSVLELTTCYSGRHGRDERVECLVGVGVQHILGGGIGCDLVRLLGVHAVTYNHVVDGNALVTGVLRFLSPEKKKL